MHKNFQFVFNKIKKLFLLNNTNLTYLKLNIPISFNVYLVKWLTDNWNCPQF